MSYKNRADQRKYAKKHYWENKATYKERDRLHDKLHRELARRLISTLKDVPCADCGVKYPSYVMDFDHLNPKLKAKDVSTMIDYSLDKIVAEAEKCQVVCSNCHRRRTWNRCRVE